MTDEADIDWASLGVGLFSDQDLHVPVHAAVSEVPQPQPVDENDMDEDDMDWAAAVGGHHHQIQPQQQPDNPLALALLPVPAAPAVARARPPRKQVAMAAPLNRSEIERHYAASRMREFKMAKKVVSDTKKVATILSNVVDIANEQGLRTRQLVLKLDERRKVANLGLTLQTRRGQGQGFTYKTLLKIGFSEVTRMSDAARAWSCSRVWVSSIRKATSMAFLTSQAKLILMVQNRIKERPLTVGVFSLAFDETSEKLLLPLHPGLLPSQQRSSWHVLVSHSEYSFGVVTPDGDIITKFMQVLRPPIPLMGTGAECIYGGLFKNEAIRQFVEFEETIAQHCTFAFAHFDRDGATPNDRLLAFRSTQLPANCMISDRACGNHCNNLVEASTLTTHFMPLINKLYSASLLLRQGAYFMRLIHSVHVAVEVGGVCDIRRGVQPPVGAVDDYRAEMRNFVLCNFSTIQVKRLRAGLDVDGSSDEEEGKLERPPLRKNEDLAMYMKAWDDFVAMFNGALWGGMVHYCTNVNCCSGFDENETKRKMKDAIIQLLFRRMPAIPIRAKWTKTLPCVHFWMMATQLVGVMGVCWPLAFKDLDAQIPISTVGSDVTWVEEVHWRSVQGSRARTGTTMVQRPETKPMLLLLGIVMESSRLITSWMMKRSSHSHRFKPGRGNARNALSDFVDPSRSPITRVLQDHSKILTGAARRLLRLWLPTASSFAQWSAHQHNYTTLRMLRYGPWGKKLRRGM
jgi:hypothetical protein